MLHLARAAGVALSLGSAPVPPLDTRPVSSDDQGGLLRFLARRPSTEVLDAPPYQSETMQQIDTVASNEAPPMSLAISLDAAEEDTYTTPTSLPPVPTTLASPGFGISNLHHIDYRNVGDGTCVDADGNRVSEMPYSWIGATSSTSDCRADCDADRECKAYEQSGVQSGEGGTGNCMKFKVVILILEY